VNFIGRYLQWISIAVLGAGFATFAVLNMFYGPDTGAPFNPAAGLMLLSWVLKTPLAMLSFGAVILGVFGLAAGSALIKK
jgi:hypothetical protein